MAFGPEILGFFLGYISGSIPFGLLLAKLSGYGDIREIGSGNIGATNVLRTGNKALALLTLLLDASKVAIVIFVYHLIYHDFIIQPTLDAANGCIKLPGGMCGGLIIPPSIKQILIIVLGGVLGHCFPIWLKFKGGKGVATTLGALLVAIPEVGFTACGLWLASALTFRISSLSALIAIGSTPIAYYYFYMIWYQADETYHLTGIEEVLIICLIVLLVFWRHKENIQRLLKGEEPKIGKKKDEPPAATE